jgi:signal transduction histidine kinase
MKKSIIYLFIFFLLSLFAIIGFTIQKSYQTQEELLHNSLKNKAITIFNLIVDMRHWNAQYDGVYVKTETLQPNPYLKPNFIKSDKNETLVWINPAFMTRQISDIASQRDGFKLKITSNKLINKHNAPDAYEKKILTYFENNPDIPYYWDIKNNDFKFMGALKTEQDCLKCHKQQGYKVGDVRGGISVSFDIKEQLSQLESIYNEYQLTILFLFIAAIGVIITLIIHEYHIISNEKKISKLNSSLESKVLELDDFNKTLHNKVQQEVKKQRENEKLLIQQSKLAALGEMIGNIAHQWRQPISAISTIMMNIKWTAISAGVDKKFLDERMEEANEQLEYMSRTIDDFRNFFKPDKAKSNFDMKNEIKKAYHILEESLKYHNINLQIAANSNIMVYGYANEFSQVILNLLSNAKDVLIERDIYNPKINIEVMQNDKEIICKIFDNGGGIEENHLEKIFEPYFTTKSSHGTGIGLYIAKEIIENHMNGKLHVENLQDGACFSISLNLQKSDN